MNWTNRRYITGFPRILDSTWNFWNFFFNFKALKILENLPDPRSPGIFFHRKLQKINETVNIRHICIMQCCSLISYSLQKILCSLFSHVMLKLLQCDSLRDQSWKVATCWAMCDGWYEEMSTLSHWKLMSAVLESFWEVVEFYFMSPVGTQGLISVQLSLVALHALLSEKNWQFRLFYFSLFREV